MPELHEAIKDEKVKENNKNENIINVLTMSDDDENVLDVDEINNNTSNDNNIIDEKNKQKKSKKLKSQITKKSKVENESKKDKLIGAPIEQITNYFEKFIEDEEKTICDQKIIKLGYKCGKIIYGIKIPQIKKDFRILAFKARKRTKSVEGKSRAVFFFGILKDHKEIAKNHLGSYISEDGKCSTQTKSTISIKIDKITYNDIYNNNQEEVLKILKSLTNITIKQKNEDLIRMKKEQEKLRTEKNEKKKTVKKMKVIKQPDKINTTSKEK
jgi:hypothetical protein